MSSACVCHTGDWCFYCEVYQKGEEIERLALRVAENVGKALRFYNENEQLKADKAALLECVKLYAEDSIYCFDCGRTVYATEYGAVARECLVQIGGSQ